MDSMRSIAIALLCLGLGGCVSPTDPLGRQDALEEAQKRYTELIRWGDVVRAGAYVDPELRADFLELATAMAGLRITDFEVGDIEFDHDKASVMVIYRGYAVSEYVERSAREVQEWHRDGLKNNWQVRPALHDVVAVLAGRTATPHRN